MTLARSCARPRAKECGHAGTRHQSGPEQRVRRSALRSEFKSKLAWPGLSWAPARPPAGLPAPLGHSGTLTHEHRHTHTRASRPACEHAESGERAVGSGGWAWPAAKREPSSGLPDAAVRPALCLPASQPACVRLRASVRACNELGLYTFSGRWKPPSHALVGNCFSANVSAAVLESAGSLAWAKNNVVQSKTKS